MIEVRINSVPLDLMPGSSVSFEINNPLFAEDVFPGAFSLPFDLALSSKNKRMLGFPELLILSQRPKLKYKGLEIWIDGVPWKRGDLIFRSFAKDRYRVNLQFDTSVLGEFLKDLKIADLDFPIYPVINWQNVFNTNSGGHELRGRKYLEFENTAPANEDITVSINGKSFTLESTQQPSVLKALVDQGGVGVTMEYFTVGNALHFLFFSTTNADVTAPFNISVSGAGTWDIKKYYRSQYLDRANTDYRFIVDIEGIEFPNCYIDNFYGNDSELSTYFNNYDNGLFRTRYEGFVVDPDTGVIRRTLKEHSYIPMPRLSYVLDRISEVTGLNFAGDFIESEIFEKLIFFNTHSQDIFENVGGQKYRLLMDVINPADHLPNMSVVEMLLELKRLFALGFDYNPANNTLEIYFLKDQISSQDYVENSPKFNPDYEIEYNPASGLSLAFDWDSNDLNGPEDTDYNDYVIGDGEIQIKSKFSTVLMQERKRPRAAGIHDVPVADQSGSWYGNKKDTKPRILLFEGLTPDSNNDNYMFASSDALAWHGANGLYEKFWKGWAEFLINDIPSRRIAYWSIVDLLNFQYKKKYRIDGVRYFIKKLSFTVTDRINPIEVELMKAE
jgi:hypothetical protein